MPNRSTSRESYKKITDLADKQLKVLNALKKIEPASDRELSLELDVSISNITPRRGELVDYGFAVMHGKKFDFETGRSVIAWVSADPMAQSAIKKSLDKSGSDEKSGKEPAKKYLLKLKSGRQFTISEAMKNEVEASIESQRGSIELAGHSFAIKNILQPIQQVGATLASPAEKEETREVILVQKDGKWCETNEFTNRLRRSQTIFRTQKIGIKSGNIVYDMMTYYPDGYETLKDMKEVG